MGKGGLWKRRKLVWPLDESFESRWTNKPTSAEQTGIVTDATPVTGSSTWRNANYQEKPSCGACWKGHWKFRSACVTRTSCLREKTQWRMDTWMNEIQKIPILYVLCCSVLFRILHWFLQIVPSPDIVDKDPWRTWKWRNLSVSLVHSLLTGTWAVACVIQHPAMVHEIHSTYTPSSYLLVVVSSGYFIQDAADIVFSGHAKASWEFLLHHVMVLWCFLYAVFTHQYVAGAVVALFVEVNSVFLHTRLLLNLAKVAHSSLIYTVNKMLNVITYVTFRLGAQFYLTWYLIYHFSSLDYALYFLTTMMLMNIMILIYFYRLLRSDFYTKRHIQNGIKKFAED